MTELRKVGTGKTVNVNINCGKKKRNEWSDHLRLGSILLLLLHIPHLWSRIQFEQHSNVGTTLPPVDKISHWCTAETLIITVGSPLVNIKSLSRREQSETPAP